MQNSRSNKFLRRVPFFLVPPVQDEISIHMVVFGLFVRNFFYRGSVERQYRCVRTGEQDGGVGGDEELRMAVRLHFLQKFQERKLPSRGKRSLGFIKKIDALDRIARGEERHE